MGSVRRVALCGVLLGFSIHGAAGDEFERIEGETLAKVSKSSDATSHQSLNIGELDALPAVVADSRSAFLVVKTDQGNFARLLVAPAFRKPAKPQDKPIPVFVLERFDTFESGNLSTRLAHGKDVLLFEGFHFDLDSGQVVPAGQGGDLKCETAKAGFRVVPPEGSQLFTLKKLPAPSEERTARPSPGRGVVPGDYAGRYRLFANGQWSGTLDVIVDAEGIISGKFRSDLNGTSYQVDGAVLRESPQKVQFTIRFPRTRQDFEGWLWTAGKGAMAGTLKMLDHTYGFFALREGGRFASEEDQGNLVEASAPQKGRLALTVKKGQLALEGRVIEEQALQEELRKAIQKEPATWVLVKAPADEPFAVLHKTVEVLKAAGITTIRFAPDEP